VKLYLLRAVIFIYFRAISVLQWQPFHKCLMVLALVSVLYSLALYEWNLFICLGTEMPLPTEIRMINSALSDII